MQYDFDEYVERRNTGSAKWDCWVDFDKPADVLPFWVADMDFRTARPVIDAIKERAEHGIFGYGKTLPGYREAVIRWYKTYFGWEPEKAWMVYSPGIVFALGVAIRAYTKPGDAVLIQRPVYYPFSNMIRENDRRILNNPLIYENGTYRMDFADFERKIVENDVKLFILCSPHNPIGRVWTRDELLTIGDICVKHGVTVVADEIHSDFVYPGHKHTMFSSLKPEFADIAVTCTAPSKTFNLAGLQLSHIWIANEERRNAFKTVLSADGYDEPSVLGMAAAFAAYKDGREWFDQLLVYLRANADFAIDYLAKNCPAISVVPLEGTYLMWLDCSKLPYDTEERQKRIAAAKLWFDPGAMFGPEGDKFERINLACPQKTLEEGLRRLCKALNE